MEKNVSLTQLEINQLVNIFNFHLGDTYSNGATINIFKMIT